MLWAERKAEGATSEPWPIKAGVINPGDAKEKVPGPLIHNAAAPISVYITIKLNASLIFRSGGQPPPCAFKRFNVHFLCSSAVCGTDGTKEQLMRKPIQFTIIINQYCTGENKAMKPKQNTSL